MRSQRPRFGFLLLPALLSFTWAKPGRAAPSSTTPEKGYDAGEMPNPRALGMGGAMNALGASTTALFMNPATLPFARVYHLEAFAGLSPEARRQTYGGAAVDSILNRQHLAGGLGGSYSVMDPEGIRRKWTDIRLALAYPLGDRISVGGTARYLRVDQAVSTGPLGASLASDGNPDGALFSTMTFDAGVALAISESIRAGVVGHNLTNPGTALAPTAVAGGLGFTNRDFSVEVGTRWDFTTFDSAKGRAMLGAELFLQDRIALRAGYRYDDGTKTHAVSGGLGYMDKKWSAELSVRRDIVGAHPSTLGILSLRYFYDAVGGDEPDPM